VTLKVHTGRVAFSPDGKRLASASNNQMVKVWDAVTGHQTLALKGHSSAVTSVVFSPDGKRLASASEDQTVKLWDARPWTPELRAEQAARSAVEQARSLVDGLFASSRSVSELIRRIEKDTSLRPEVRQQAVEIAKRRWEDPLILNNLSWGVAAHPGAVPKAYAIAVRQAEAACRLEPDNGLYVNTLGVAQYRVSKYQNALDALKRSDKLNSASKAGRQPADVAFLAMANFKLGQKDKSQTLLGELRQLMKQPKWSGNGEAQGFLREAEELLAGKK